jgi:hypothetical protein
MCYTIYAKNNKKPACLANRCGIVDIAPDPKLNRMVNAFFQVEMLEMSPGYAEFQKKLLKESGLADETPDTILEMKYVMSEYREKSKDK